MPNNPTIEEIVSFYSRSLYSYVFRLIGNKDEAKDLVQEVFIKVWKNLDRYDQNQDLKTWLFTIAHRTVIDWTRKKRPLVFSGLFNETDSDDSDNFVDNLPDLEKLPDEIFAQKELRSRLNQALEKLSLGQKEILLLRLEQDLTLESIALTLDRPLNTVKSLYRRALIALRGLLSDAP